MIILDTIGHTPLVLLEKISHKLGTNIFVKLESRNPSGSVKDRLVQGIMQKAIERGDLKTGYTMVEATSGNTGIALALLGNALGFKTLLTMPDSMSVERRKLLTMFGAELVLTPAKEGMDGASKKAQELLKERKNSFYVNQFVNPDGIIGHYYGTGVEIIKDFETQKQNAPAAFVCAFGTGTTITGTGRRLKENLTNIQIFAVEPEESPLLSKGYAAGHRIQGIGANFIPPVLDKSVIDTILTVNADEAIATAKELMRIEGISCGITSGANVAAAIKIAPQFKGQNIVTIICDSADKYLSTALGE